MLKVPDIQGGDIEAQMQSRGPNHKIFDGDGNTFGGLFALAASGKLGDGECKRMNDHVTTQLFHKGSAPLAISVGFRSVDAVGKFDNTDGGERAFLISTRRKDSIDNLLDGIPASFARNEHTGI